MVSTITAFSSNFEISDEIIVLSSPLKCLTGGGQELRAWVLNSIIDLIPVEGFQHLKLFVVRRK